MTASVRHCVAAGSDYYEGQVGMSERFHEDTMSELGILQADGW